MSTNLLNKNIHKGQRIKFCVKAKIVLLGRNEKEDEERKLVIKGNSITTKVFPFINVGTD